MMMTMTGIQMFHVTTSSGEWFEQDLMVMVMTTVNMTMIISCLHVFHGVDAAQLDGGDDNSDNGNDDSDDDINDLSTGVPWSRFGH